MAVSAGAAPSHPKSQMRAHWPCARPREHFYRSASSVLSLPFRDEELRKGAYTGVCE